MKGYRTPRVKEPSGNGKRRSNGRFDENSEDTEPSNTYTFDSQALFSTITWPQLLAVFGILTFLDIGLNQTFVNNLQHSSSGNVTDLCDASQSAREHMTLTYLDYNPIHRNNVTILHYLSILRSIIILAYLQLIHWNKIRTKYLEIIKYIIYGISYLFICHIISIILTDSHKKESFHYFSYWLVLLSNIITVILQTGFCYVIWTKCQICVTQNWRNANKKGRDNKEGVKKGKTQSAMDESNSTSMTVIIKKLIQWYKPDLGWIILGQVLLAACASGMQSGE